MSVSNPAPADARWNHNLHYHPVILGALPARCGHVLDVGCGEGTLARALSDRAARVTGIDLDAPTVELARREAAATNVEYVVGDVLTHPFEPASFDAVVSVATLHHIGTAVALARLAELLRPGGPLVVVGLARSRSPADLAYDLAGAVATRLHRRTKKIWESTAPQVWPPPESYGEVRRTAREQLPGARYRRHLLWRYSLVWTKPGAAGTPCPPAGDGEHYP